MARSFHRKRSLQPNAELNVTALIDLGFALLIIFMISTPLIEKEQAMEMNLPVTSPSANQAPAESIDIFIADGSYRLNGNPADAGELELELARYAAQPDQPVFSLRANAEEPYQNVATVIDLMKKHKLRKLNLVTRPDEG